MIKGQSFSHQVRLWLILIVSIGLSAPSVQALRCYECSSAWSDDCNLSPPPARYLKLCSSQLPVCSKFYASENGVVKIERYCGGSDYGTGCRDASITDLRSPAPQVTAISCRCSDKDGCNSATSNFLSLTQFGLCLLLALLQKVITYCLECL